MKKEEESGYEYTDRLFKMIGKNPKHTLPLQEAVDYIKFYGLNDLLIAQGRIGIVGKAAIDRLDKALVWEGYQVIRQKRERDKK